MAASQLGFEAVAFTVWLTTVLGTPWSWRKFRGGPEVEWVGFSIVWASYKLGVSSRRAAWIRNWIEQVLAEGSVDLGNLTPPP